MRRGFQELLEAGVSSLTGAQLHERCPDQRSTHRNGYRRRLLTTLVGALTLAIPKLRQGSFFPDWLEPRRRVDKALYAVVMEAYTGSISTRKVDAVVEALGSDSGISKSEVSRICQGLDEQVKAFLGQPQVTEMLRKQYPGAVPVMEAVRDNVLAFLCLPQEHWRKIWSTNPLERLNVAPIGALCELPDQTPHQRRRHLPQ